MCVDSVDKSQSILAKLARGLVNRLIILSVVFTEEAMYEAQNVFA